MNQVYLEKKFNVKKNEQQVDRCEVLISRWVEQWRVRRAKAKVWDFWQKYAKTKGHENRNVNFCDEFYERGLL